MTIRMQEVPIFDGKKGINNVDVPGSSVFQPPDGFLRVAENVDLTRTGEIRLRHGYTKKFNLRDGRAMCAFNNMLYVVDSTDLLEVNPENWTSRVIETGLPLGFNVVWNEHANTLWWQCGNKRGAIFEGNNYPWGVEVVTGLMVEFTKGRGSVLPGTYLCAATITDRRNEVESGVVFYDQVTVDSPGSITIVVPNSSNQNYTYNFYISGPNGTEVYYRGSSNNGIFVFDSLGSDFENLVTPPFKDCYPPPELDIIAGFGSYLLGAKSNVLYWSQPISYHHWKIGEDFQMMPTEITMLAPLNEGFFIGTTKGVYWVQGRSADQWAVKLVDQAPASYCTPLFLNGDKIPKLNTSEIICIWNSYDGLVAGLPNGQVVHLTSSYLATDAYQQAHFLYREFEGIRQILMALSDKNYSSRLATVDTATCTVIRSKKP